MTDDDRQMVSVRLPSELVDALDSMAEEVDTSRSQIIEDSCWYGVETGTTLSRGRLSRLKQDADDIIEQNQELRKLLPSKWRNHLRDLFADHIRDNLSPEDLRHMADGYRRQARNYEQQAAEHPTAPEADLVGIVDEELNEAMRASDLSNYYEGVSNVHERRFSGVAEGQQERQDVVALVEAACRQQQRLMSATEADYHIPVMASDLPVQDTQLPANVSTDDLAAVADELVRQGVDPDDVADVVPTTDPRLAVDDQPDDSQPALDRDDHDDEIEVIEHVEEGDDDPPEIGGWEPDPEVVDELAQRDIETGLSGAELELACSKRTDSVEHRKQLEEAVGQRVQELREQSDTDDGDPNSVDEVETQSQLIEQLPAADGGRDPASVAPGCDTMRDTEPGHDSTATEATTTESREAGEADE